MRTPEQLTTAAWKAVDELMANGTITLPNGVVLKPEAKVVVDVVKWLAQFQGKPRKTPKAMDNWKPAETK